MVRGPLDATAMSSSYSTHHSRRKEVAAARLKRRPRAQAALPLSAVLAQHPQLFDGRRITAVDKNVCTIDALRCASEVRVRRVGSGGVAGQLQPGGHSTNPATPAVRPPHHFLLTALAF